MKGRAPEVPRAANASAELLAALDAFESDAGALERVLQSARAGDASSLWNLLGRVEPGRREAVLARLVELVGRPEGLDDAKVLALDAGELERLWQAFP